MVSVPRNVKIVREPASLWNEKEVYPEYEYIVYDTLIPTPYQKQQAALQNDQSNSDSGQQALNSKYPQKPNVGYIESHVDNHSTITFLAMLGQEGVDFVGGKNMFYRGERHGLPREYQLQKGDAVFFRGEKLKHWITPVTSGCRTILQCEFSRL